MSDLPYEPDLLLTLLQELPTDMRAIWGFAVMHAQFKTLCLALELGVVTRLAAQPATTAELAAGKPVIELLIRPALLRGDH